MIGLILVIDSIFAGRVHAILGGGKIESAVGLWEQRLIRWPSRVFNKNVCTVFVQLCGTAAIVFLLENVRMSEYGITSHYCVVARV